MGIDYDATASLIKDLRPKLLVVGASSYPLSIDYPLLAKITSAAGTLLHADLAHMAAYVAGELHPPAFPHVDTATIDTGKNLRGPKGGVLVFRTRHAKAIRRAIFPVGQSSPNQSALLAKAYLFEFWDTTSIHAYARSLLTTAHWLAGQLKARGLPLLFEGTDSHLILVNVAQLGLTGKAAEIRLEAQKILTNRNSLPGDNKPAWIGSGLRIGTSTLTILKYDKNDVLLLADTIADILLKGSGDQSAIEHLIAKRQGSIARYN